MANMHEMEERHALQITRLNMEIDSVVEKAHFGLREAHEQISRLKARLSRQGDDLASERAWSSHGPHLVSCSTQWNEDDSQLAAGLFPGGSRSSRQGPKTPNAGRIMSPVGHYSAKQIHGRSPVAERLQKSSRKAAKSRYKPKLRLSLLQHHCTLDSTLEYSAPDAHSANLASEAQRKDSRGNAGRTTHFLNRSNNSVDSLSARSQSPHPSPFMYAHLPTNYPDHSMSNRLTARHTAVHEPACSDGSRRKVPPQIGAPSTCWDPSVLAFDDRVDSWSPRARIDVQQSLSLESLQQSLTLPQERWSSSSPNVRPHSDPIDDAAVPPEWTEFLARTPQRAPPSESSLLSPEQATRIPRAISQDHNAEEILQRLLSPTHARQSLVEVESYNSSLRLKQEALISISPRKDNDSEGLSAREQSNTLFVSRDASRITQAPENVLQDGVVVGVGWGKTSYVRQVLDSSRSGISIARE